MSSSYETIWNKIQLIEEIIYKCSLISTGNIEEQTSFMRQTENEYVERIVENIIKDTKEISNVEIVNDLSWDCKKNNSLRTVDHIKFKLSANKNEKFEIDCILKQKKERKS